MVGKAAESAPAPPKKPMAAFFLYKSDRYAEFVKTYPEKKIAELTQLISKEWAKESQESKDAYQQRYLAHKKVFDEQMKAYVATYGKPAARKRKLKKEKKEKKPRKGAKGKREKAPAKKEAPADSQSKQAAPSAASPSAL